MRKFALPGIALPLSLAGAVGLSACAMNGNEASVGASPRAGVVKSETITQYQPGVGVVTAVSRAPMLSTHPGTSGAAGDTRADTFYRLAVRMESGGIQYVDSQERYPVGTRIELTPDKYVRRL